MSLYTVVGVASHYVTPPALLPVTVLDGAPDVAGGEPSDPTGYTRYVSVVDAADDVEAMRIARQTFTGDNQTPREEGLAERIGEDSYRCTRCGAVDAITVDEAPSMYAGTDTVTRCDGCGAREIVDPFTGAATIRQPPSTRSTKRPHVGQRLSTSRHGVVTVTCVHREGLTLDVLDAAGRPWRIDRAETGTWTRAEEEQIR